MITLFSYLFRTLCKNTNLPAFSTLNLFLNLEWTIDQKLKKLFKYLHLMILQFARYNFSKCFIPNDAAIFIDRFPPAIWWYTFKYFFLEQAFWWQGLTLLLSLRGLELFEDIHYGHKLYSKAFFSFNEFVPRINHKTSKAAWIKNPFRELVSIIPKKFRQNFQDSKNSNIKQIWHRYFRFDYGVFSSR